MRADLLSKRFSWDEDLHPRDAKGRFIRTWRELLEAYRTAEQAWNDFDDETREHISDLATVEEQEAYEASRAASYEGIEVALTEAEVELYEWLGADKGLEVPPPRSVSEQFRGARPVETGAPHLDSLEGPTGPYADLSGGPMHRAFVAYAMDDIRKEVNQALRTGGPLPTDRRWVVEKLDEALAKAPVTTESLVAVRGLSMAEPPDVGDVIIDRGYSSMIGDRETAVQFALGRSAGVGPYATQMKEPPTGHAPVLVEILIPTGSKVLTDGWETITRRGSAFEIVGRRDDGTLIALLRQVEP